MKQLTKYVLPLLAGKEISRPSHNVRQLPETVLQFGTGMLLRGLPDYYINKANNAGVFNGRVVVVKSTSKGSSDEFAQQDNLYTHCIKGIETDGATIEKHIVNAAISRVVNAADGWEEIIALAANPQLQVVISNTTEVGIVLDEKDDIYASPPQSFPGKLLACLSARYQAFAGSLESGLIIIPTELIVDNGTVLKDAVYKLAQRNRLKEEFINWLLYANDWCSSLVDRIVPGALPQGDKTYLEETFGYTDSLAIMSEPYGLWAIETKKEQTKAVLSFSKIDDNIIVTDNIQKYRELKLRLLNATHTFCCGAAFLSGFDAVNTAMNNEAFQSFIHQLVYKEIVPCILSDDISETEAKAFADAVLKRFANPFIHHQWLSISLQYTSKMNARCLPLINTFYQRFSALPYGMVTGFAAYLAFMNIRAYNEGKYYGQRNGSPYLVQDEKAPLFFTAWKQEDARQAILQLLDEETLWNNFIVSLPSFRENVVKHVKSFLSGTSLQQLNNHIYGLFVK